MDEDDFMEGPSEHCWVFQSFPRQFRTRGPSGTPGPSHHHQASAEQQTLDLQGCVASVAPWLDFPGPRAPKMDGYDSALDGWLLPTNWMASPFQTYVTYVYIYNIRTYTHIFIIYSFIQKNTLSIAGWTLNMGQFLLGPWPGCKRSSWDSWSLRSGRTVFGGRRCLVDSIIFK